MPLEQQQASPEQKTAEPSWKDKLTAGLKEGYEYATLLVKGDREGLADHYIEYSEEFDDEEARAIADTVDIGKMTEYLESGKQGSLEEGTLLYMNTQARTQASPYISYSPEEFAKLAKLFTTLNQNWAVAEQNANDYVKRVEESRESDNPIFRNSIKQAPAYVAGIHEFDQAFPVIHADQELFARSFPGHPDVEPQMVDKILASIAEKMAGISPLEADREGCTDQLTQILERDKLSPEQKNMACDAIISLRFGPKVQENADALAATSKLIKAVVTNPEKIPPAQYIAIMNKFYGESTTHGYMPEDIRNAIAKRTKTMKDQGKISETESTTLSAIRSRYET